MAKKMYYTADEAAARLGVSAEEVDKMARQKKLRAYADGPRRMYRVDEVDAIAPAAGAPSDEVTLTPADTSDVLSLADSTDTARPPTKEDTVITAAGISIFDDEDLEIEAADPMAKTQISSSLEDHGSDSVGSGSGLLDLTRESDDTSLGAEILGQIEIDKAIGSSIGAAVADEPETVAAAGPAYAAPAVVEEIDSSAGLFGGMAVGLSLVALLVGAVAISALTSMVPGYLDSMAENLTIVLAAAAGIVGVGALAGFFLGKSAAQRQLALRRSGAVVSN